MGPLVLLEIINVTHDVTLLVPFISNLAEEVLLKEVWRS